tara:strand:- start:139 stop:876 length:738 start_codon:yes stop_codon:yes gene_type:complete
MEIDGRGGVLGQTTVPVSGGLSKVIVGLDVEEDWFLEGDAPSNKIDFSSTVTHEVGHAIGIDHSQSSEALMNANYSTSIFELQKDDIDAAVHIYGENDLARIEVYRFFNPKIGSHLFTSDFLERDTIRQSAFFNSEGTGFEAIAAADDSAQDSVPIFRFFNTKTGGHFFTASEVERRVVSSMDDFVSEGVGFRAFDVDTSSTVPIYRFFNTSTGGHFFTASEFEKDSILDIPQLRYEGEAFYAFS